MKTNAEATVALLLNQGTKKGTGDNRSFLVSNTKTLLPTFVLVVIFNFFRQLK